MTRPCIDYRLVNIAIRATAKEYGVSESKLFAKNRRHLPVEMRMICWFVLKAGTNCRPAEIGKIFGFDHGTVLNAWGKIVPWLRTYPEFRDRYNRVATAFRILRDQLTK